MKKDFKSLKSAIEKNYQDRKMEKMKMKRRPILFWLKSNRGQT